MTAAHVHGTSCGIGTGKEDKACRSRVKGTSINDISRERGKWAAQILTKGREVA